MNFDFAIGTDIEEIRRFENKTLENDIDFLNHIFTDKELEYCYKNKKYAQHLCARFCAKEAVIKALSALGADDLYYKDIEILKSASGAPYADIKKIKDKGIQIKLSMSHCRNCASASAIAVKE